MCLIEPSLVPPSGIKYSGVCFRNADDILDSIKQYNSELANAVRRHGTVRIYLDREKHRFYGTPEVRQPQTAYYTKFFLENGPLTEAQLLSSSQPFPSQVIAFGFDPYHDPENPKEEFDPVALDVSISDGRVIISFVKENKFESKSRG